MISPQAIVDPGARLAEDVQVGPFAMIGAGVEIEAGCVIGPHTVIKGPTKIGRDNRIFQFSCIGEDPQDKKYSGEPTRLEIGDRNTIREYCTINRGTMQDKGVTRIGDDNWIMAYAHIAHDCQVGNGTIFANAASLAGHVEVGDFVILGGFSVVHQFCSIGAHAFSALGTVILKDVPPYVTLSGNPARPRGINAEGLRRRGFDGEAIREIRRAYKTIYKSKLKLEEAQARLASQAHTHPELRVLADFLGASNRSIIR